MEEQEYKFCMQCGAKVPASSKFCTNCGTPFEQTEKVSAAVKAEAPSEPTLQPAEPESSDASLRQIISKNVAYYLKQFERIKKEGRSRINLASFFLGLIHAAYRNVWKDWMKDTGKFFIAMYAVILIGSLGCLGLFQAGNLAIGAIIIFAAFLIALILGIIYTVKQILFSLKFNKVYYRHAEKKAAAGDFKADPSVGRAVIVTLAVSIATGISFFAAVTAFSLAMLSGIGGGTDYEIYNDYEEGDNYSAEYDNSITETVESSYDNQDNELKDGTYIYDDGSSVYNTAIVSEDETGQRIDIESMGYGGHQQGVGGGYLNALGNGVYTCFDDSDYGTMTITLTDGGFSVVTHPAEGMETMYTNLNGEYIYNGSDTAPVVNEPESTSNADEYIFPDSNTRYLTDSDVSGMDKATIRLGINEIYARHGRAFETVDLNEYFSSKSWYTPLYSADEFAPMESSVFNDYEKKNIEFLAAIRDGMSDSTSGFKADWVYGKYYMDMDAGGIELEVGYYSDTGADYIALNGSYADSAGSFDGVIVSSDGNSYTAMDEYGNEVDFIYNGIDSIEITNAVNTGGMYFPGFEGTYEKTQDY